VLGEWAIATTTLEAGAATAGAAEPARIDPAAPSARIAEVMMLRPVRMIPPWHLPRSASRCATSSSCSGEC